MRRQIIIVRDSGSRRNLASVSTYLRALGLWRIPSQVIEVAALQDEDLSRVAVVIAEEVLSLPPGASKALVGFVREGGSLILGGLVGMEKADRMPEPVATLSGVRELSERETHPCYRVPLVVEQTDILAPWDPGTVLFFHNPAYSSAARARDFDMTLSESVSVLARSSLADLVDEKTERWDRYRDGDAPTLVENRPFQGGGRVLYSPLALGLVDDAKCMTTSDGSTRPEMRQENHATQLLIKTTVCALARAAGGLVPSVALWPHAARAVFALSGDTHEYPDMLDGNLRCEFAYIPKMKELVERKGLAHKFTYCIVGRTFDYHPAVVREIAGEDIIGHPYADLCYSLSDTTYGDQVSDIAATLAAIQRTVPMCKTFRLGWRDHGVTGNHDSRHAIEALGFLYASDYQCSAAAEWNWKRFRRRMIVHVNYPLKTRKPESGRYRFWELPYIQSDIDLMQRAERGYDPDESTWFHRPGEPRRAWNLYVDRAMREESLVVTVWHPWASLRTARERAEVEATMDYMLAKEGAAFMSMSEVALWWDERDRSVVRFDEVPGGWQVCLQNPLDRGINDLAIIIKGGAGWAFIAHRDGERLSVEQRDDDAIICIDLAARSEIIVEITWEEP